METFKKVLLSDKNVIEPFLQKGDKFRPSDAFGTMFLWKDVFDVSFCICDDTLFRCYQKLDLAYSFPLGDGDKKKAIDLLLRESHDKGKKLKFTGITEDEMHIMENLFPGVFDFIEVRDSFNYIYNVSDLAELCGKKYHSKRNFISRFEKSYDWSYEGITSENLNLCRGISKRWSDAHGYVDEEIALNCAFDNFEELGLLGGILYANHVPIAFTIGEKLNDEVFDVHFEKALSEYVGAFAMIRNQFVKNELVEYKFVNLEEDLGIEGLRKAKLSYHPMTLQVMYDAIEK